MTDFPEYRDAVHRLIHDIPKTPRRVFDDNELLAKNKRVAAFFGDPQNTHPAVHVAGTSGKGSICYSVEAILRAHGKRTGLLVSPHVYDIRERIQLLGSYIRRDFFSKIFHEVDDTVVAHGERLSYFEMTTMMGYVAFGHSDIDYQVIETGMGGRLDATNTITRKDKVCILAQIGLDHVEALGHTLEKIAEQKAGIVQPGNYVVALEQAPEVMAVFEARAKEMNATLEWIKPAGAYEVTNTRLTKAACRYVAKRDGWHYDEQVAHQALDNLAIPARFEKRMVAHHTVILDGAHNLQKLGGLVDRLERTNLEPVTFVLALGEQRDIIASLMVLKNAAKRVIATEYFTQEQDIPIRPIGAAVIVEAAHSLGIECEVAASPASALAKAKTYPEPIVVTGSFYLVSELDEFAR